MVVQIDVGALLDGTYRIDGLLGSGGMGTVYRAAHLRLGEKRVAVKTLHAAGARDPQIFERFRREAQVVSRLANRHIVDVFDFNVTPDGVAYMVMEYLEGETLR